MKKVIIAVIAVVFLTGCAALSDFISKNPFEIKFGGTKSEVISCDSSAKIQSAETTLLVTTSNESTN